MIPVAAVEIPSTATGSRTGASVLWALLFGNFVIGTGVMMVAGTLNEITGSFGISAATAGQLIWTGGILMCLAAPLSAAVVAGWDRRRLLALTMLWYGGLHLACALTTSFEVLLVLRVLALVSPAVFTPQAAACVGMLVAPERRGHAITFVFLGWSAASVLGMPIGAYVGGTLGWSSAFAMVGFLSLASALWVWRAMPDGVRPPSLSLAAWRETLGSPALMLCIAVTVLYSAGQFVLMAYLAPYFKQKMAVTPTELSLYFMWFGAFGFLGNIIMARNIDRFGPARAVLAGTCSMALTLLLWPLGTTLVLASLVAVPWALGCFASNSAQQARLVALAPALASGSVALNSSAMHAGQAIGAGGGGWLIVSTGTMEHLHWAGLASMLGAMALSTLASRLARGQPGPAAAG